MDEALFFISKSCRGGNISGLWLKPYFSKIKLTVIGLFLSASVQSQVSLRDFNLSHLYDPLAEISLGYNLQSTNDSLIFQAQLVKYQDKANIEDYIFNFYLINSYDQRLENPIPLEEIDSIYIGKKDNEHYINFAFPKAYGQNLLAVKILSRFTGYQHYYDIPIATQTPITLQTDTGSPIINSWVNPGRYLIDDSEDVFGYYYDHEFPTALPPMVTKDSRVSRNMGVDSTFIIRQNEVFIIKNTGLYLLQTDTTSYSALAFRLEDRFFPRSAKLDQLVEPLIYITTKEERKSLMAAKESKAAFDDFWLDLTRSSERARDIIKNYYDRVEEANRLFTTYKPGWKTDRGMIYITFGPPGKVIKSNNEETWIYLSTRDLKKIEFKFVKASSIFSNSHYALVRDKKYADAWYKAIRLIRQGRFRRD